MTFAAGLIAVLVGITYGIQPYGGHTMGWTSPFVIGLIGGGRSRCIFCVIETRVAEPMFKLALFKIRPVHRREPGRLLAGPGPRRPDVHPDHLAAGHLPADPWIQLQPDAAVGRHRHAPADRWFPRSRPVSGWLSDRFGARPFATGGMLVAAASFVLLKFLPVDFVYWQFAGISFAPNFPPSRRTAAQLFGAYS